MLLVFLQETVCWNSLRGSCLLPTTCLGPATACIVNVSLPSALAPSPAHTCNPAPSCGAPEGPTASWSAKPDTSPGRTAPAVVTVKYASEEPALIRTPPCTSRWENAERQHCQTSFFSVKIDVPLCLFLLCLRWMVGGGSGDYLGTVLEVVVEEFSWPRERVTTPFLRMEANTAMAFASNIAHVTSTLALKQVR